MILNTIHFEYGDIKDQHFRFHLRQHCRQLFSINCLGNDLQLRILTDDTLEPLPDQAAIIGNDNAIRFHPAILIT